MAWLKWSSLARNLKVGCKLITTQRVGMKAFPQHGGLPSTSKVLENSYNSENMVDWSAREEAGEEF